MDVIKFVEDWKKHKTFWGRDKKVNEKNWKELQRLNFLNKSNSFKLKAPIPLNTKVINVLEPTNENNFMNNNDDDNNYFSSQR